MTKLRQSPLAHDFSIQETPRALHQPYLAPDGTPKDQFFTEPTGVFNTAELLINQMGLTPGVKHGDGPGLQLLLNSYVEDVQNHGNHFELVTRNTLSGQIRTFSAVTVVLAAGSIESPKLLRRSSMYPWLPDHAKIPGRTRADRSSDVERDRLRSSRTSATFRSRRLRHAKIIFYSRGLRDGTRDSLSVQRGDEHQSRVLASAGQRSERANDAGGFSTNTSAGPSRIDIKFSFGNCLDDANEVKPLRLSVMFRRSCSGT